MFRRFVIVLLLLCMPLIIFGGTTGKISGIITDSKSGEALVGVNVMIQGTSLGSATDSKGQYYIFNVSPGIYTLEAAYIGYAKSIVQNARVTIDLTTTVDFAMITEVIQGQEVIVVAKAPLIEKKATNSRRVVRREDIENIPVRDTQSIVATQTGAVKVGNQMYIRGGRAEEVAYYVDGVYQVNDFNRFDRPDAAEISSTALEEVSFQAGGFDAEYGSATSGLVNMATKVGGRKYSISGELASSDFLSRTESGPLNTFSYGKNIASISISGPLVKDLSFYANIEKQYDFDQDPKSGKHPEATYIGHADSVDYSTYEDYTVDHVYGPHLNNDESKLLGTGNILFSKNKLRLKIGGNFNRSSLRDHNFNLQNFMPYSIDDIYLWESLTTAAYAKLTMTLNPKTIFNVQVSTFTDFFERGHPDYMSDYLYYGLREASHNQLNAWDALTDADFDAMFQNEASHVRQVIADTSTFDRVGGDYIINPQLSANGTDPASNQSYADFFAPGTIFGVYEKNETSYKGLTTDLKMQLGPHEMKFGADARFYTIRYYQIGAPERIANSVFENTPLTPATYEGLDATDQNRILYADYDAYIENYWFQAYKYAFGENMGYDIYGEAEIDGDKEDNRDAARQPLVGGIYFQDKIELKDLIMNLGIRYDYIDANNFTFRDPYMIVNDESGSLSEMVYRDENGDYKLSEPSYDILGDPIDIEGRTQLVLRDPLHYISPKLGLAFPVTDKTVFHAQYGKYVQQPRLSNMYLSYTRFASNIGQGNFTTSANPELEPMRTTSYEMGFKQQFGENISIDMTLFYKQMIGFVQIRNLDGAQPIVYANFQNGDYGSIKGLSFAFNMRRIGYVRAFLNYTLQYANGTGSMGNTVRNIAWQSGNFPTFSSPLDFDQRHTGNMNIDIRTTKRDFIKEVGLNFLFAFGSGRRYTPVQPISYVFDNSPDIPVAQINSGYMPWTYQLDMKLDKKWTFGPVKFNTYLVIKNLTGKVNIMDVHDGTGLAGHDGYLDSELGQVWSADPDNHRELYVMAMQDVDFYELPRTMLAGIQFYIGK